MNIAFEFRLSLILITFLLVYSCQQESKVVVEESSERASIPCNYIHDINDYVDCIYQMNPDTQSLGLEPIEAGIPDLTHFASLTTLMISSNGSYRMKVLNPEILKVKWLKHLVISKSKLASIPEDIIRLENLETLTVAGGGYLDKLPDNLSQLKKLRVLNLWRNSLTGEALDFTGMDALELVVIGENDRVDLRKLKKKWPKLKVVDYFSGEYY